MIKYLPFFVLPFLFGCPMSYWGGEMAGRAPGVHASAGNWFEGPSFGVTSDCEAEVESMEYKKGTDTQPTEFKLKNAKFGQKPSLTLKELPAVLTLLPAIQRTQAEYAQVWATAITDIVDRISNVVAILGLAKVKSTTSGMQLELPGGITIGGQKVTNPGQLTDYLKALQDQLAYLRANPPIPAAPATPTGPLPSQ